MISNFVKLEKDETAYSWLKRIAAFNGMEIDDFTTLVLRKNKCRRDVLNCLKKLCSYYNMDLFEVFLATVLQGMTSLYNEETVSSLVGMVENIRFVPETSVNETKLYLCPECMKEDIEKTKGVIHAPEGYFWYHKAHHIPGVVACYKHECPLLEFSGDRGQEDDLSCYKTKEISAEDIAYSKFTYSYMNSGIICTREDVMEAVYAKLKEDGYFKNHINKDAFAKAFPGFSSSISTYPVEKLLKFLHLLFGDVETLSDYLMESTIKFNVPEGFKCMNKEGHVLKVEHSCGNRFLTTEFLLSVGYGCPECDKKLSEQDFLSKVFQIYKNGEYEPQENLMFSEKGVIKHSCGKILTKPPKHILFKRGVCRCSEIKTFEDAKRFVEQIPEFELVSFETSSQPVRIRHKICGEEFPVFIHGFLNHPFCRECETNVITKHNVAKRLAFVSDYEIVNFERAKKPITLRHKICGNSFDIYVHDFIERPFCRVCENNRISDEDVQEMIGEEYDLIEFQSSNVPMTIRHKKCGKSFQIKYWSFKTSPGCRECESRFVDVNKMSFLISKLGDYELTGFTSVAEPIRIKHLECGREFEADYYVFKDNPHCYLCDPTIKTFAMAKEEIAAMGDFELIKYGGVSASATILHKTCGQEFTIYYNKFLERPWCKCCNSKNMTTEKLRKRIEEETNGEYELVSDFVDQNTKISVHHKKCGETTQYIPPHWHNGARCPHCTGKNVNTWNRMFSLLCDYKEEFGNTDIPKRDQYKGQQLGHWCNNQRVSYKEKRLSKANEKLLRDIGFVFDPLEKEWNRRLEQYRRYVKENGSVYISRRTDFEGEHLGAWVETQRKWYNAGKLSKKREEKLLEINPSLFTVDNVKEGLRHHPVYTSNK